MEKTKLSTGILNDLIQGVKASYSKKRQNYFTSNQEIANQILGKINELTLEEITSLGDKESDKYFKSIIFRIIATYLIIDSAKNNKGIDIKYIWNLIFKSLINLEEEDIISSIGSQGFLAVPLFRIEKQNGEFYLLRLHIWDSELDIQIDENIRENLSIHTHQFHANSWIVAGEVYNTEYEVTETANKTDYNLFQIEWNKAENKLVKKTSIAKNTGIFVDVKIESEEAFLPEQFYEVKADKFYKSRVNEKLDINSTLFLFSSLKSRVPESKVLGPSEIKESKINRKVMINPTPFLKKINNTIQTYD